MMYLALLPSPLWELISTANGWAFMLGIFINWVFIYNIYSLFKKEK